MGKAWEWRSHGHGTCQLSAVYSPFTQSQIKKAKGKTPIKKYSNATPDALGFTVAKQRKKCPIDFSVLALGKI